MAPVPLATGMSAVYWAMPIMGPPAISLKVFSFTPPQASSRAETGVPMGHSRFLGSSMPEPETVTILRTTGMPVVSARKMAQVVLMLNTAQPMSAGSPPGGT